MIRLSWVFGILSIASADDYVFDPPIPHFPGIDPALVQAALFPSPPVPVSSKSVVFPPKDLFPKVPQKNGRPLSSFAHLTVDSNALPVEYEKSPPAYRQFKRSRFVRQTNRPLLPGSNPKVRGLEDSIHVQFPSERVYRLDDGTVVSEDSPLDGGFKYSYQTPGGTTRHEGGSLEQDGGAGALVKGKYSYRSPEGRQVSVLYTANRNGFTTREEW